MEATQLRNFSARLVALVVALNGLGLIAGALANQLVFRMIPLHIVDARLNAYLSILLGLSLLYVSLPLARKKYTAWLFTFFLYCIIFGFTLERQTHTTTLVRLHQEWAQLLLAPAVLIVLWLMRKAYVVRSDYISFTNTLKFSILVIVVSVGYGVGGYMLMDIRDYRQEITAPQALLYTVDQFGLTTNRPQPHTRRALVFEDSLTFISLAAAALVFVSLFQPVRARYVHRGKDIMQMRKLIYDAAEDSEDYFKIWPTDKFYIFSPLQRAGIAYKVQHGYAMAAGAPVGNKHSFKSALQAFHDDCLVNDWRPVFIHILGDTASWLERQGYRKQLIGQEAVVDVAKFTEATGQRKHFREIRARFARLNFTAEVLTPPHTSEVISRLQQISHEWLERPGRTERGFMMGYFSPAYLQQCRLLVARDSTGAIQGFVTVVPSPMPSEANIDLFRSSTAAPGNINDFMFMELIRQLHLEDVTSLNLGLCPLAGLEDEPSTMINRALRFAYAAGDRLYSFKGLYRFKSKYEPAWRDRYIAYRGAPADLVRIMRALDSAMKV